MERTCEEATMEEPARCGARPLGWLGAQRGQEARQQKERSQGGSGQKPQEDSRRQAQRATAKARALCEQGAATPELFRVLSGLWTVYLLRPA
jgi:hypothetical protein